MKLQAPLIGAQIDRAGQYHAGERKRDTGRQRSDLLSIPLQKGLSNPLQLARDDLKKRGGVGNVAEDAIEDFIGQVQETAPCVPCRTVRGKSRGAWGWKT